MQTKLIQYIHDNLNKIKFLLKKIKTIERDIKRKKESLQRLTYLYKAGFIEEKEYKQIKEDLLKEINLLESNFYDVLGHIKTLLDETKKLLSFNKEVTRISKKMTIKIEYPKIENAISYVENFINTYLQPINQITKKHTKEKIKYGKKFVGLKKILNLEKKKKEETKIIKNIRLKKIKKKQINYLQYLYKISNRLFGKISDWLIKNFPDLYLFIYNLLRKSGIKMTVRTYISILISLSIVFLLPILLIILFILQNFILGFSIALLSLIIFILCFIYYPYYIKKEKIYTIRSLLPFVIVHMASLAKSGISPKDIFKVIAETKEYKYLADEFKKIVDYMNLGFGLSDAIRSVAEETPSEDLKEFLEGLLLSLQSGSSLREYLEVAAESAIIHYKTQNEKFVQTLKTFSDIYVGMVVTMPIILVSVIIMLASLAERVFGLPIPTLTLLLVYVIVPIINIGMLFVISKIQPK